MQHHYVLRTETRKTVYGSTHVTAVIQSRLTGLIIAVDAASSDFGEAPRLQTLKSWKNGTPVKKWTNQIKAMIPGLDSDYEDNNEL